MNSNFNIVRKPKKDDEVFEEEDDDIELDEEKEERIKNDAARKRMIKFMGIIICVTVVVLLILYVISLLNTKSYTYSEIEDVLKEAAVNYFNDNKSQLPASDGDQVEIDSSNLVVGGYMKNLSEYLDEGVSCTGKVIVEKTGTEYLYTPYLSCGDNYSSVEFYSKVTSDENIVSSGYGLYAYNGGYVFRGEEVNNYVKLDGSLWRIVKITSNNNVVLISNDGITTANSWDDRYNENKLYEAGINTYSASRVREYLDKAYAITDSEESDYILSSKDKTLLSSFNICTGKRTSTSSNNDNSSECSEVLQNQRIGLLTLSDYLYASIDTNCKSSESYSCSNYNYLASTNFDWWLATANSNSTDEVYMVNRNGKVKSVSAGNYATIRPVIYLSSQVQYSSGSGTLDDPYIVK